MADFCKQCSIELFGEDFKDMANITTVEDFAKGLSVVVICEHCGTIQVDPEGNCISPDCLEGGHMPHSEEIKTLKRCLLQQQNANLELSQKITELNALHTEMISALTQMIGTHGEVCKDPDWKCDSVRFSLGVLERARSYHP